MMMMDMSKYFNICCHLKSCTMQFDLKFEHKLSEGHPCIITWKKQTFYTLRLRPQRDQLNYVQG